MQALIRNPQYKLDRDGQQNTLQKEMEAYIQRINRT